VTELLFFASMGDLQRCKRIVQVWNLKASYHTSSLSLTSLRRLPTYLTSL
jgi:hypothetical protein